MPSTTSPREIVIIGGGIIGCTTAYFLTHHALYNPSIHKIILLEATSIAGGASGKAGGLVALWAYPACLVKLSFQLHADLAARHGGDVRWGYRRVKTGSLDAVAAVSRNVRTRDGNGDGESESVDLGKRENGHVKKGNLQARGVPSDLDWFRDDALRAYSPMGDESTTAQVHPELFTKSMIELAQERGVEIVIGTATSINQRQGGGEGVESVTYTTPDGEKRTVPATDVVIAAGPWTKNIWPSAPISALRAHSVTIRPKEPISAYAVFTEIEMADGKTVTPEIYARPNNEAYACGEGDTLVELPSTSAEVEVDQKRCQEIINQVGAISDHLRDGEVLVRQACYLPNVEAKISGPLIGPTSMKRVFMAAGHTCWGISNSCATGKLMSEFIFDGEAKSAKIKSLDPRQVL